MNDANPIRRQGIRMLWRRSLTKHPIKILEGPTKGPVNKSKGPQALYVFIIRVYAYNYEGTT